MVRSILLFGLAFFIQTSLQAQVLDRYKLMEKTIEQMTKISEEVTLKTGFHIYVSSVQNFGDNQTIFDFEKQKTAGLVEPYALLVLGTDVKKVDLLLKSGEFQINKDDVLGDYVIPILAEKRTDLSDESRYSAALYNGFAHIAGQVASQKQITLTTLPEKEKPTTGFLQYIGRTLFSISMGVVGYLLIRFIWRRFFRKES